MTAVSPLLPPRDWMGGREPRSSMIGDARYLEALWRRYRHHPSSVSSEWRNAFWFIETMFGEPDGASSGGQRDDEPRSPDGYYPRFGHLHADLDPLKLAPIAPLPAELSSMPPDDRAARYLGTVAVETGHFDSPEMQGWTEQAFDTLRLAPTKASLTVYQRLIETQVFDQFLAAKFPGKKRFGSEGADAILPLLHHLRDRAKQMGIDELVLGSMHRGRFSILANFMDFDPAVLLSMIAGDHPFPATPDRAGDMAYHFGGFVERGGMRCTLLPNPSHLEAVNPVVAGYARARRAQGSGRAMAILIHTDASVVGQGVNAELLQMSRLAGFEVGGTLHVVINNQVGFTTEPSEARSSRYCTGAWRAVDSLIVHANGDDVDGVIDAGTLALDFRDRFACDAVIDLVCYRANGHNEIDEPRFTQPLYYRAADAKGSVVGRYERRLIEQGLLDEAGASERRAAVKARLDAAFAAREGVPPRPADVAARDAPGELSLDALRGMVERLSQVPEGRGHPKMMSLMQRRLDEAANGITWALAETMALASALDDGVAVRFCGQDIERGPFSQRHLAAVDAETGVRRHQLASFARDGATLEIVNSPLSEYAVLGFEYGYALAARRTLCIWEAQFGDFANGAQIVIDQFIASGSEKWCTTSALTVLLPHGLEGQGPEHSSARVERLLQLCARDNMRVAIPSTPANYFHLLRDQAVRSDRPLFVLTPKVLLRLPEARSPLADFGDGNSFHPVIVAARGGSRAILCSGKIAYELERERDRLGIEASIVRLELLYPFPAERLAAALVEVGARTVVWLQEEPKNYGAGAWLMPRLAALPLDLNIEPVVARPESSSPAGSFHGDHDRDQRRLWRRALGAALDEEERT